MTFISGFYLVWIGHYRHRVVCRALVRGKEHETPEEEALIPHAALNYACGTLGKSFAFCFFWGTARPSLMLHTLGVLRPSF